MKTHVRDYNVTFDGENWNEDANGAGVCSEFTENGITKRVICIFNENDLSNRKFAINIKHQFLDGSDWKTIKETTENSKANASDETYVVEATGALATEDEAFEYIDDLSKEVLDINGASYDPPVYEQIKQMKAGYIRESDYLISQLGPVLFPTYLSIMKRKFQIA